MSVNGKTCWTKTGAIGTSGAQTCGGFFKEEKFRVTGCYITLSPASGGVVPLTVRVWTNLDGEATDESFGIDNFVLAHSKATTNPNPNPNIIESIVKIDKFDDPGVLGGWNCGQITKCGAMGNICGGFNVKGKGSDIKQTFMLPVGTYSVELDFIRIDSWFVWVIQ